jgi:hypothetical protein
MPNENNVVETTDQSYDDFLEDFKLDPSITILSKNCLSLLNEYAQLNGQTISFQIISQSGQSHQPM